MYVFPLSSIIFHTLLEMSVMEDNLSIVLFHLFYGVSHCFPKLWGKVISDAILSSYIKVVSG